MSVYDVRALVHSRDGNPNANDLSDREATFAMSGGTVLETVPL